MLFRSLSINGLAKAELAWRIDYVFLEKVLHPADGGFAGWNHGYRSLPADNPGWDELADANGNRLSAVTAAGTANGAYDAQDRLTRYGATTYSYTAHGELRAKGEFELNHADLGMQPFTVMLGALAVGEKLSFSYDIKARRDAR